jgi:2,4-dienoyl-CoA reductase-like NADH-dependent reductase (Old Yellow Enzyme family)
MTAVPDRRREKLLPIPRWPTREEAEASRWFSRIQLGPVEAQTRTWIPAMVPWRATEDGFVTPEVISWYDRFARGEPGVIVVEATGIRDVPSGPLLRIGHDRYVEGLSKLVEAVRHASSGRTRLFIQLIDFLSIKRRPPKDKFISRFLTVDPGLRERLAALRSNGSWKDTDETSIRQTLLELSEEELGRVLSSRDWESYRFGHRERVTDLQLPHIRELPQQLPPLFAQAAARAKAAGFDGVELHYAHAYTMAGFLSARNDRPDGYGGPREQRVRLPLEVYRAVRAQVGIDYAVGCRFLGDEVIEGGNRLEDAQYFGRRVRSRGDGLPQHVQGRQVRGRAPTQGRRLGLSVHGAQRPRVHAHHDDRRPRSVRPERRARGRRAASRARGGPLHAGGRLRRDRQLLAGRGDPRAR